MGSKVIKRISAPRTWPIPRKVGGRFITKPNPGGHSLEHTLPLVVVFRDVLKKAETRKEVKRILYNNTIQVDGVRRKDLAYPFGLLDTLYIKEINEAYRLVMNTRGKLELLEIPPEEVNKKIVKIKVKKHIKGGDIQLGLDDGRTIIVKKEDKDKYKVGDSLFIEVPSQKILDIYKLEPGCWIYISKGRHAGVKGKFKSLEQDNDIMILETDKGDIRVKKEYGIIISKPDQDPPIKI